MELKKSFLARLFGSGTELEASEESPPPASPQEPPTDTLEPSPRHELHLSPDHSIHRLWSLRRNQSGWLPKPCLSLEGEVDPLMPEEEAKMELLRLQLAVNSSANARYEKLRSSQQGSSERPLPNLDAQVTVFLSKDNLTAWLLVYPPVGSGKELDLNALTQALSSRQVSFGVDNALLDALPQDPDRYFRLITIARGTAMIPGLNGRVVDIFPRTEERKLTVDENNRVDYTDLNFIHNVEQGGTICRIFPATEGTPGRTVQDQIIPIRPGKPVSVPKGRNTELSEDGSSLVASITGHVEFSGRAFQVKPVLDIPANVDFSVGDINFLGDVCIHGDIRSGFTVRAMGSITVDGVVEACTVEAGRDLVVARGVQGDNQAVIRAQRSVYAKYLENCSVYAKESLEAECVINCGIYCDGSVTVRTGHRSIIGGEIHSAHEVSAGVVGSRVGNRTDIILGGQPCEDFDLDMLTKEIQELEQALAQTERQPDSPSKVSRMSKMRMQLLVNQSKLELSRKEREQMVQEEGDSIPRRLICDTVFPGTVLSIGGVSWHFDDKMLFCSAALVDGEIRMV